MNSISLTSQCRQCWHEVELSSFTSLLLLLCQHRRHCDVDNVDTMFSNHRLHRYCYFNVNIVDITSLTMLTQCWVNIVYIVIFTSMSTSSTSRCWQCWHDVELTSSTLIWTIVTLPPPKKKPTNVDTIVHNCNADDVKDVHKKQEAHGPHRSPE
jgi:hypothetical protein